MLYPSDFTLHIWFTIFQPRRHGATAPRRLTRKRGFWICRATSLRSWLSPSASAVSAGSCPQISPESRRAVSIRWIRWGETVQLCPTDF